MTKSVRQKRPPTRWVVEGAEYTWRSPFEQPRGVWRVRRRHNEIGQLSVTTVEDPRTGHRPRTYAQARRIVQAMATAETVEHEEIKKDPRKRKPKEKPIEDAMITWLDTVRTLHSSRTIASMILTKPAAIA